MRERERELSSGFLPKVAVIARVEPDWNQDEDPGLLMGFRGPRTWAALHCLPRHISMELLQKWSSQAMNQHTWESAGAAGISFTNYATGLASSL